MLTKSYEHIVTLKAVLGSELSVLRKTLDFLAENWERELRTVLVLLFADFDAGAGILPLHAQGALAARLVEGDGEILNRS